jgi:hypothetical protein
MHGTEPGRLKVGLRIALRPEIRCRNKACWKKHAVGCTERFYEYRRQSKRNTRSLRPTRALMTARARITAVGMTN